MAATPSPTSCYPKTSDVLYTSISTLIPIRLDSSNFTIWKFLMTTILKAHNLLGYVNVSIMTPEKFLPNDAGEPTAAISPSYETWMAHNAFVNVLIHATLSNSALSYIIGCDTARELWLKLEENCSSLLNFHIIGSNPRKPIEPARPSSPQQPLFPSPQQPQPAASPESPNLSPKHDPTPNFNFMDDSRNPLLVIWAMNAVQFRERVSFMLVESSELQKQIETDAKVLPEEKAVLHEVGGENGGILALEMAWMVGITMEEGLWQRWAVGGWPELYMGRLPPLFPGIGPRGRGMIGMSRGMIGSPMHGPNIGQNGGMVVSSNGRGRDEGTFTLIRDKYAKTKRRCKVLSQSRVLLERGERQGQFWNFT